MKLLIITQKVDENDDLLGFFNKWLGEIAKFAEEVRVICLYAGTYALPENVKIYSLGKENGKNKLERYLKFYQLIFKLLPKSDKVLAHMCPEYIVALAPINIFYKKDVYLWYTHKQLTRNLKLADKLVKKIFTASKDSCRLESKKIKILGHGIDTERFQIQHKSAAGKTLFKIIYIGRLSRIKNQKLLLEAADILVNLKKFNNLRIDLVGGPQTYDDLNYLRELNILVKELKLQNYVNFIGAIPYHDNINYYRQADLSVNLSPTGGLDKTVLESMAGGVHILIVNQSFSELLGKYKNKFILEKAAADILAEKIIAATNTSPVEMIENSNFLREQVVRHHDLNNFIKKLIDEIK